MTGRRRSSSHPADIHLAEQRPSKRPRRFPKATRSSKVTAESRRLPSAADGSASLPTMLWCTVTRHTDFRQQSQPDASAQCKRLHEVSCAYAGGEEIKHACADGPFDDRFKTVFYRSQIPPFKKKHPMGIHNYELKKKNRNYEIRKSKL